MRRIATAAGTLLMAALPAGSAGASDVPEGVRPQIGFAEQAAGGNLARGLLSGQVEDLNGVTSFWVAVRASRRTRDGFCRWWSTRLGRLDRRSSACQEPEWMPAAIRRTDSGFRWKVRLGGRPPQGHYIVVFRAADGNGNVQRALPDGRRRIGIDVSGR